MNLGELPQISKLFCDNGCFFLGDGGKFQGNIARLLSFRASSQQKINEIQSRGSWPRARTPVFYPNSRGEDAIRPTFQDFPRPPAQRHSRVPKRQENVFRSAARSEILAPAFQPPLSAEPRHQPAPPSASSCRPSPTPAASRCGRWCG